MTPSQLDHLRRIDAHLTNLLENAKKRTPGKWVTDSRCVIDTYGVVTRTSTGNDEEDENNAAFIASCAGSAEAGWKSTKDAIALCIANLHTDPEFPSHDPDWICDNDGRGCRACAYTQKLADSIMANFPLPLVSKS